ncbi:unnamed protein product [Clonostachys rhizophaga]|uniref:Uncharacterized protein n=1 Tax=Clonostachys rhizophaga TaxID=160324 RepID=A0A9N9VB70_9HYPO|nr:unnamed protein product [Clonostachys rhizophaga]
MVSFFGIKLGGKKSQKKQEKTNQRQWKKGNEWSFAEDQFYGHELAKPTLPLSRPGTSQSSHSSHTSFRPPYANNGASSSMVDLSNSAPRPIATNLRPISSNPSLKGGRVNMSSPVGPPASLPFAGSEGSRPGTPTRPGTAGSGSIRNTKDWSSSLDGQYGRDPTTPNLGAPTSPHVGAPTSPHLGAPSRMNTAPTHRSPLSDMTPAPGIPRTNTAPVKSPLSQFEPRPQLKEAKTYKAWEPPQLYKPYRPPSLRNDQHGSPSPPPSISNMDRRTPSIGNSPQTNFEFPPASNATNSVSPAKSAVDMDQIGLPSPPVSEDRWDNSGRNSSASMARRDTMMFHSPRRKSISRTALEAKAILREQVEEDKEAIKKRRQTEGFEGNFSAFNFGQPVVDNSIPLPTSPLMPAPKASSSPAEDTRVRSASEGRKNAAERGMSEPMSAEILTVGQPSLGLSLPRTPDTIPERRFPENVHARGDSDTRAPNTPTALQQPDSMLKQRPLKAPPVKKGPIPGAIAIPPKPNDNQRPPGPLSAKALIEGDFPVMNGLPRGRRVERFGAADSPVDQRFNTHDTPDSATDDENLDLPHWVDRADRHMSAMPAPLSPLPNASFGDREASSYTSSPTSPVPPQLPSPTFMSLEKSISNSSENFSKSFELATSSASTQIDKPLISPVRGEFRVEAQKAPPRPPPIALPPGAGRFTPTNGSLKSPVEVSSGYI